MKNTAKILIVFFIVLIVSFLTYFKYTQDNNLHNLPVIGEEGHRVGSFSFLNQDGKTITDKDVQGKIRVVEYFFTTCESICPKMNENMVKVYQEFRNTPNVVIMSHTCDPEIDTVVQMKKYAQKFEASADKWMFLTGSKDSLYIMALRDYLISAGDSTQIKVLPQFIHDQHFVLIDPDNRLRGQFYDGTEPGDVQQLIGDIKILIKEYK